MSATRSGPGTRTLCGQLDRFDTLLDGFSDALRESVADAVRAVVADVLREELANIRTRPEPLPGIPSARPPEIRATLRRALRTAFGLERATLRPR